MGEVDTVTIAVDRQYRAEKWPMPDHTCVRVFLELPTDEISNDRTDIAGDGVNTGERGEGGGVCMYQCVRWGFVPVHVKGE